MRILRLLEAVLVPTLAALVVWAFAQLSDPYGLPFPLTLGAGVLCAGGLLTAWWRERTAEASRDVRGPDVPRVFPIEISSRVATIAMAALLVIAVALRFYGILDRPAWEDEMWTLRNFYTADIGELLHVAFDDYWPPLHYLILNTVARVADTSLIWLRTPSALFGCATVFAMYWLGRDLFGRRIAGVLAAMLVAGMTAHVLYSQEARVYAMHLFLAVLSAGYFYRSFHEKRISPAFLITTTLLTYSHSFASWYFIAGQCVYVAVAWLIWRDGEQFKKGFLSQLAVLLLWMPLVGAFAYSRLARDIVVPTYWATGPEDPMGLFDVVELYQSLVVRSWAGAAFLALFFALALLPLLPRWRDRAASGSRDGSDAPARDPGPSYVHAITFLLCWVTVPVAFSYVVSMATTLDTFGVGASRYHLTVLPALCLLAVAGIAVVRSRTALVAVTLLLVLLPAAQLKRHYRDFALDRPDVQGAVELVRTHGTAGEPVYIGNSFRSFAYYDRGIFPRIGSAQWDSLATAHAHLTDLYTMQSVKRGDTYAYEKIDPRIRYIGWYGGPVPARVRYLEEQLAGGGFDEGYWLVLSPADRRESEAVASVEFPCSGRADYRVNALELIHCPGEPREAP